MRSSRTVKLNIGKNYKIIIKKTITGMISINKCYPKRKLRFVIHIGNTAFVKTYLANQFSDEESTLNSASFCLIFVDLPLYQHYKL